MSDDVALESGESVEIDCSCDEMAVIEELLELDQQDILELGCGRGEKTRAIAEQGAGRRLVALEVDEIQHGLNLGIEDLPNVSFGLGAAEDIPAAGRSFDVVLLFKSLHHVPVESMDRALAEIARVLRPGGVACISEPLFRGDFNEVLRIFHDESRVRRAAFEAIERAVRSGSLELISQTFIRAPLQFANFEEFERVVIGVTHSNHVLTAELRERVRSTFARNVDDRGARFEAPLRIDLLRRTTSVAGRTRRASG